MTTRRGFIQMGAAMGASLTLPGCSARSLPLETGSAAKGNQPYPGLLTSLKTEHRYQARVVGKLPEELTGALYINGPGLFERGGLRKRSPLDGDGMIAAFRIGAGKAEFQNRYVRTTKFEEEERAGEFLYSTWTTQSPGGVFANLGGNFHPQGQAGVSVRMWNEKLYAFDESQQPWEMDSQTLDTIGFSHLGLPKGMTLYSAHPKVDPVREEWVHFGLEYGRKSKIHLTVFAKDGSLKSHRVLDSPRYVYLHDFFVTERYFVLLLHPREISVFRLLLGLSSLTDSFGWEPQQGNLILVVPREGDGEPVQLMTDSRWMWHVLNAYEAGGEIVAEFVGYDQPDALVGHGEQTAAIMANKTAVSFDSVGKIRRYVMNPTQKTVREEILDQGAHEFPFVNPAWSGGKHRYGYFVTGGNSIFHSGVVRVNMETGKRDEFRFGPGKSCLEPVFAPKPGFDYRQNPGREPGWLLTMVYDGKDDKSYLAVLDAERVAEGPVAEIHLSHHVPLRFHGHWERSA